MTIQDARAILWEAGYRTYPDTPGRWIVVPPHGGEVRMTDAQLIAEAEKQ